jgi:uncharacterized membrane protein YfcA
MKKRWPPAKAAAITALIVFAVVMLVGAVLAAAGVYADPEAAGERIGRPLLPVLIVAGLVAYFVQRDKIREDAKREKRPK